MKNLSFKICLVVAAFLASVGSEFASGLPPCKNEAMWKGHNCFGSYVFDGGDKFEKGTKKAGAGAYIDAPPDVLNLSEGWSTGCTIHPSTKKQVLFCLDAKTLVQTTKLL